MSVPVVSIVIITYNHGPYIGQCLDGVLMQKTNFPIEVIIGEDCSTDDTRAVIQKYERQHPDIIKPIYHQKNVGPARNAYEFCLSKITGRYIAICEGDDYWTDPFKLQKQIDFLEQNPECVLCFHKVNSVNKHGEIIEREHPADKITYYSWKDFLNAHVPPLSAVFRNCMKEIPQEIFLVKGGDKFLFGMLTRYGKLAKLGFVGANYRRHSGGIYSSRSILGQFIHNIHTRRMMSKSSCFTEEQKKVIHEDLARIKFIYMKHFFKKNQILNCLKIAFT